MKKTSFAAKSLIALLAAGMISCAGNTNETATANHAGCKQCDQRFGCK